MTVPNGIQSTAQNSADYPACYAPDNHQFTDVSRASAVKAGSTSTPCESFKLAMTKYDGTGYTLYNQ